MKTKKGFALVFTLIIMLIVTAIIISLTAVASGDLSLIRSTTDATRAYYLAEAGLAKKFAQLRGGNNLPLPTENLILSASARMTGSFLVNTANIGGGAFPIWELTSRGTYGRVSKTIVLTVRQITIARYIYLTNLETRSGSDIWFIGGDIIRGPLHTNGRINIYHDPVFQGPVSSVGSSINYWLPAPAGGNHPDFQASLTLGAPNITLPQIGDIVTTISSGASSITYDANPLHTYNFSGDTKITLLSNGTMNVTNSSRSLRNYNIPLPPALTPALFVNNGNLDISGILNGQLTVATNKDIHIVGSIMYKSNTGTDPLITDTLGIVSQNNVIVASAASSAPGFNLEIDAYILALNKSFYVENYTSGLKGTLTLYGGITQVERGAVGTFDANTGLRSSGYQKDYKYDARFEDVAPAYFPPAKDANNRIMYLKTSWREI